MYRHRYLLAFDPKGNLMPMASRRPRKKAAGRLFILQNCWLFLFLFLCRTTTRGEWQQPTWSASWVSGSRMNFYWLQIHSYIIIIITPHSCSYQCKCWTFFLSLRLSLFAWAPLTYEMNLITEALLSQSSSSHDIIAWSCTRLVVKVALAPRNTFIQGLHFK